MWFRIPILAVCALALASCGAGELSTPASVSRQSESAGWVKTTVLSGPVDSLACAIVNGNPALLYYYGFQNGSPDAVEVRYMRALNSTGSQWPATSALLDTSLVD